MYGFFIGVYIVVCCLLIAVILMQKGRGGGLSETLGGGFQAVFGPRVTNMLVKATAVLAILFFLLTLTLARLSVIRGRSLMERAPEERTQETR